MEAGVKKSEPEKLTPWKLVILCLSMFVLVSLFYETAFRPSEHVRTILGAADTFICFIFIVDFFLSLFRAKSKREFLRWGWIDLVSSIPAFGYFRWGRTVRAVRILRLLRSVRTVKALTFFFIQNRAKSAFAAVTLISITLVFWSSIIILSVETRPNSNIKTAGDALWWSVATIATAGFGDLYPVTPAGRLLGALLLVAGVGLFGAFTGFVASWFLEEGEEEEDEAEARRADAVEGELREIKAKMGELEALLRGMNKG
jgi:voltage-gated potassium channel